MFYFVKTPWWLKKLYGKCIWDLSSKQKIIYLTFDDGPHLTATPFVLNELKKYNAKATFFCIGKNVVEQKDLYKKILGDGHAVGNHTYNHLNGWKTGNEIYLDNISEAKSHIDSNLFRPPYGKIKRSQIKSLRDKFPSIKIIMWSVLSADFDKSTSPRKCLGNVIKNAENGAVIVFHDSGKAFNNMAYALPKVLEYFSAKGYVFEKISN